MPWFTFVVGQQEKLLSPRCSASGARCIPAAAQRAKDDHKGLILLHVPGVLAPQAECCKGRVAPPAAHIRTVAEVRSLGWLCAPCHLVTSMRW